MIASPTPSLLRRAVRRLRLAALVAGALALYGCAAGSMSSSAPADDAPTVIEAARTTAPDPDPRVGLEAGLFDAEEAIWNLRVLSRTPPPETYVGSTNSDLAFKDDYAIQGNYDGVMVWDISDPRNPTLVMDYLCPASQSDVSVYGDLLFVSGEGLSGRLDCGTQGVDESVSHERLRGIRIFDITDIRSPEYIANVQTCRGSHTHSVLKHPGDDDNLYVYVSGSAPVRPAEELPGCVAAMPDQDPNTALFRIEVIRVPLANPEAAEIVSSPRIFTGLERAPEHGAAPADLAEAREEGGFIADFGDRQVILRDRTVAAMLQQIVEARGGSGPPTAADSAALREYLPEWVAAVQQRRDEEGPGPGPTQCHDITLYPEIGLAGGACEGYGMLLDISDPVNPTRIDAVSDRNFSYWHSATFNNAGDKILFTDEWGGGGQPKCRPSDPREWGANAIFTIDDREMDFQSYYKLPAPQTPQENCVAHNGSMIPIPGRDVMVQGWYQGGISVFDWTDPENPVEIAFHDRGPVDADEMEMGGSWSVYWYNGVIVNSEIARGLDIFELTPSPMLTQNEIDAANTVELDLLNAQMQPRYVWPATFALARAYVDQLERSGGLTGERIAAARRELNEAESASAGARRSALSDLAGELEGAAGSSSDAEKVRMLADVLEELARG